jgi:hypothetical protein
MALERLRQVIKEEQIQAEITIVNVTSDEQAQRLQFAGSPTILVHGQDIDVESTGTQSALTCRAYQLEDGRISPLPSANMIRKALRSARK